MKQPEPLKGKCHILIESWLSEKQKKNNPDLIGWFNRQEDILSAVEWLRKKDNKTLMRTIDILTGCGYKHIAVELSKNINDNKNKAFEDVLNKE